MPRTLLLQFSPTVNEWRHGVPSSGTIMMISRARATVVQNFTSSKWAESLTLNPRVKSCLERARYTQPQPRLALKGEGTGGERVGEGEEVRIKGWV